MKKMNKKGFTLIELLAIIVILAIIAVITVPIILNVIDNAKKGAAKNSVAGYAKAIELAHTEWMYDKNLNGATTPNLTGAKATASVNVKVGTATAEAITYGVNYDGDSVTGCTINITDGKVSMTGCKVTSYSESATFKYEGGKVTQE